MAILGLNYYLAKLPKSDRIGRFWPGILIAINMLILLSNDRFDGYRYASLYHGFDILVSDLPCFEGGLIMTGLRVGPMGRYLTSLARKLQHHHVEIGILRARPSLAAIDSRAYRSKYASVRQAIDYQSPADYRKRVSTSLPEEDYNFVDFVCYCLYPPLYIAGPIITFNDFIWQVS
jgi:hypothetical protein